MEVSTGIEIANFAVLTLNSLVIASYLPSYFKKKGENKAMMEDIKGLTMSLKSVEAVVGLSAKAQESFAIQQRESLLQFFDDCYKIASETFAAWMPDLENEDLKLSREKYETEIIGLFRQANKSYFRLSLYISNTTEVGKAAGACQQATSVVFSTFICRFEAYSTLLESFHKSKAEGNSEAYALHRKTIIGLEEYHKEMVAPLKQLMHELDKLKESLADFLKNAFILPTPDLASLSK